MCIARLYCCEFTFYVVKGVLDQMGPRTTGIVVRNGVVDAALPLVSWDLRYKREH